MSKIISIKTNSASIKNYCQTVSFTGNKTNYIAKKYWNTLNKELGINERIASNEFGHILRLYSEKERRYHTIEHVLDCLNQFDDYCSNFPEKLNRDEKSVFKLGIWFHDYKDERLNPAAVDQSASVAGNFFKNSRLYNKYSQLLEELILSTKHFTDSSTQYKNKESTSLMKDIDFSILGRNPKEYKDYSNKIREEWRSIHPDDSKYAQGRIAVLRTILKEKTLFKTEWFKQKYEIQAKQNINNEINELLNRA